ncbi:hypothetical protein V6N12_023654 [Hibiscus sabdariffa]|uniref:Uncharacterized protein n=1 Tax=Hibiscus sabdariffa TaxID=183260 RepID=A0ABR2FYA4_9ROSI
MGLLDQLWDDTVAGPRPDNGLGKLRKHSTFTFRPNSAKESDGGSVRSYGDEIPEEATRVTRSIMIIKPPGLQAGSPPVSPAGSTPPVSPFSESRFDSGEDQYQTRTRRLTSSFECVKLCTTRFEKLYYVEKYGSVVLDRSMRPLFIELVIVFRCSVVVSKHAGIRSVPVSLANESSNNSVCV